MGKRSCIVKKQLKTCSVDFAYIGEDMQVHYDTAQLDFFTRAKDTLARILAGKMPNRRGITVLNVTEIVNVYAMPVSEFKQRAQIIDSYDGETLVFEAGQDSEQEG